MHRTLVLLVVGLTPRLLGAHTPHLARFAARGGMRPLRTVVPAVTCSVQSTLLTGLSPSGHGAVANGWYFRELAEVWLWRQSNRLVAGEKVWEAAKRRDPAFTCAVMFWWYNMYTSADYGVTPRPIYLADGRKIPDCYSYPPGIRDELTRRLGRFPLFQFWGPGADIRSSRWIADATLWVRRTFDPTLTLCYLPHLDYNLQKFGPDPTDPRVARELAAIDAIVGELIEAAERDGTRVIVVSEYGITPVVDAVAINRVLRQAGLLAVREELGRELLDAGASRAFAVADHQVAHIYLQHGTPVAEVKRLLEATEGVELVLDEEGKRAFGLDHPRSGELVAISRADRWFSYYWWLDDARAPDFARLVEIHRKPGYDPMELFVDPRFRFPKLAIGRRLLARALGFRTLLDVVPIAPTSLVRGSHGRLVDRADDGPLVMSNAPELLPEGEVAATAFKELVLAHLFRRIPD